MNDGKADHVALLCSETHFEVLALRPCGEWYEMPHGRLVRCVSCTGSVRHRVVVFIGPCKCKWKVENSSEHLLGILNQALFA